MWLNRQPMERSRQPTDPRTNPYKQSGPATVSALQVVAPRTCCADAVKKFLTERGVDAGRIATKSDGSKGSEKGEHGWRWDRRVDFGAAQSHRHPATRRGLLVGQRARRRRRESSKAGPIKPAMSSHRTGCGVVRQLQPLLS